MSCVTYPATATMLTTAAMLTTVSMLLLVGEHILSLLPAGKHGYMMNIGDMINNRDVPSREIGRHADKGMSI